MALKFILELELPTRNMILKETSGHKEDVAAALDMLIEDGIVKQTGYIKRGKKVMWHYVD